MRLGLVSRDTATWNGLAPDNIPWATAPCQTRAALLINLLFKEFGLSAIIIHPKGLHFICFVST